MNNTQKTSRFLITLAVLGITLFAPGCTQARVKNTAVVELEGNPSTGYTWVYTVSPQGIVREVSNTYIANQTEDNRVGSGGKFIFTFEAIAEGEAEIVFSYLRVWEEDVPPVRTVIYKAIVDGRGVELALLDGHL